MKSLFGNAAPRACCSRGGGSQWGGSHLATPVPVPISWGCSAPHRRPAGLGKGSSSPAPTTKPASGSSWERGDAHFAVFLSAAQNKLDSFSPVATESVKKEIVAAARDGCEVYFSRLFPATVRTEPQGRAVASPCPV